MDPSAELLDCNCGENALDSQLNVLLAGFQLAYSKQAALKCTLV